MVKLRGYLVDGFDIYGLRFNVRDLVNYCFCPAKFYLTRFLGLSDKLGIDSIIGRATHFGYYLVSENYFRFNCRNELYRFVLNFLFDRFRDCLSKFEIERISRYVVDFRFNFPPIGEVKFEVEVYSNRFNVSGCIDLIEGDVLVEVKCRDRLYECDLIQLCWYALLFEDTFRIDVNYGFIDLIGAMRRVKVNIDDELRFKAINTLTEAINFTLNFNYSKIKFTGKCDVCSLRSECHVMINL